MLDEEMEDQGTKSVPDKKKLYYLGASFCCLFSAYGATQALITTIFGSIGFWALFFLYVAFTLSSFYATVAVKMFGVRRVMMIASVFNLLFIVSCIPAYLWKDSLVWLLFLAWWSKVAEQEDLLGWEWEVQE